MRARAGHSTRPSSHHHSPSPPRRAAVAASPQHGPAERPLVAAVLEQHDLKQGGQDLGEELRPLPPVLCAGLLAGGGRRQGDRGHGMLRVEEMPTSLHTQCNSERVGRGDGAADKAAADAHCCCWGGGLAARLVLEVIASQVVNGCRALQGGAGRAGQRGGGAAAGDMVALQHWVGRRSTVDIAKHISPRAQRRARGR